MQVSVSKGVRKSTVSIKLSKEQNEMLVRLADKEDRTKVDEVAYLVKKRLQELDGKR